MKLVFSMFFFTRKNRTGKRFVEDLIYRLLMHRFNSISVGLVMWKKL